MAEMQIFNHATVLDGTENMQPQEDMAVVVKDGVIAEIVPAAELTVPAGAKVIDLAGKYLAPGLVNMHAHLCSDGKPKSSGEAADLINKVVANPIGMAYLRHSIKKSVKNQLMSGVTTLRSVGDPGWADIDVRNMVNAGKAVGPRMLTSGYGVTVPHGHGAGLLAKVVETPEEARELVREIADHGADLVKLFITGGVFDATVEGEPGVLRMPLEIAKATCEEAHKLGLHTAAHIESTEGVLVGLKAGVDTIEHGGELTDEILAAFKCNGEVKASSLTCTISPALPFVKLPPEKTHSSHIQSVNGEIVCNGIIHAAQGALKEGIPVGLGTDSACPYVTHYDMWREVVYFNLLVGVSPAFALYSATLRGAELLGVADETGSITVGKSADMIVLGANPLDDLKVLRKVDMVVMHGKVYDNPKTKHIPEIDAELDGILDALEKEGN